MKAITSLALLLTLQDPSLERDYLATRDGSRLAMVTLIAQHADGTPVRGYIRCVGTWFKHQDGDGQLYADALPFKTDSRGAVIMNPALVDEWIHCYTDDRGKRLRATVEFSEQEPTRVAYLTLEES